MTNNTNNTAQTANTNTHSADVIIIGAGLAGLYIALRLNAANKNRAHRKPLSIAILESSNRVGGRIHTVIRNSDTDNNNESDGIQYEAGAARFSRIRHQRLWRLLDEYNLAKHAIAISNDIDTVGLNKKDIVDVHAIITELNVSNISRTRPVTLLDIISEQKGPQIAKLVEHNYHYYAELGQLGWWDAYQLFTHDFNPNMQYHSLGGEGGLSQLPTALYKKCEQEGIKVYLDSRVSSRSGNTLELINGNKWYANQHIIYTCPADAIATFDSNIGKKMLSKIQPTPLYRIYAGGWPIYNKTQHVWFHNMNKMSVDMPKKTPLKFVIPITTKPANKSNIMISYTDSKYADAMYSALDAGTNDTKLQHMIISAFPKKPAKILKPQWIAHHYWASGAGFWKQGVHSTRAISQLMGPHNSGNKQVKIWVSGENISHYQGWMEGALESADTLLSRLLNKRKLVSHTQLSQTHKKQKHNINRKTSTKKSRKTIKIQHAAGNKKITLKELSRHNKHSDAWIAINGNVYNITDWIDKHPGGDIIMKGVGKDATKMFKNIRGGDGHPEFVIKKILPRYKIGVLTK